MISHFFRSTGRKLTEGDTTMIVSSGLGDHTIPFRLHNPRELVVVDISKEGSEVCIWGIPAT